jgi:hypothetical protein
MLKNVNKSWKRGSNFSDDEIAFPSQKVFYKPICESSLHYSRYRRNIKNLLALSKISIAN